MEFTKSKDLKGLTDITNSYRVEMALYRSSLCSYIIRRILYIDVETFVLPR